MVMVVGITLTIEETRGEARGKEHLTKHIGIYCLRERI